MERRFAVHARTHRQALILAFALASGTAAASPTTGEAKTAFDRGVDAYNKGDFAEASQALGKSFELWPDPETLFAWAQTERKLGRCDQALVLYEKLLTFDLPPENKEAVRVQMNECKPGSTADHPAAPAPHRAEPPPVAQAADQGDTPSAVADKPEDPLARPSEGRAWWRDPVGDALVGVGAIGLGVGIVSLVSAHSAEADKAQATTYFQYKALDDQATSRGQLGVIASVAGGAVVIGGIVWYVTHRQPTERATVTGWIAPGTGGFAVAGSF